VHLELSTPAVAELPAVVAELASWQVEGMPVQLHPGDVGWAWRFGADALARTLRVWTVDGTRTAIGFLDESSLVRLAIAPDSGDDEVFAAALVDDLADPSREVLGEGQVAVEARFGTAVRARLRELGWTEGEPWTPLVRDLAEPVEAPGLRVEVVGPGHVDDRVMVQRSAFPRSTFTAERWHVMAQTPAYEQARCLVGYDERGAAVAAVTVWSAGAGRPGLLEPMGVHRDHRGRGYGRAICQAAAAALRDLGSSSATVATASANVAGVTTYAAAGYRTTGEVRDLVRGS
jgi:GNAT superfamily N-acetyltransferase